MLRGPVSYSVTPSGNTLTVAPTITFKSGFAAGIQIYMYVADVVGLNTAGKRWAGGWWAPLRRPASGCR